MARFAARRLLFRFGTLAALVCAASSSPAQTARAQAGNAAANAPQGASTPGANRAVRASLTDSTQPSPPPNLVTSFQRFVQETTGVRLPVFGSEFFRAGPGDTALGNASVLSRRAGGATQSRFGVRVSITGAAARPGTVTLPPHATALAAVVAAGGPSSGGSFRLVSVVRSGRSVAQLDLYELIVQGVTGADIELRDGDTVAFQPAGPLVALAGALDAPAIYELKPAGETMSSLLAYGGGSVLLADHQRVVLERIDNRRSAARQVEHLALDAGGLARGLQDGDVLTLLPISPAIANAVTLVGPVSQPGRYPFREGMRISDLIPGLQALVAREFHERKNRLLQEQAVDSTAPRGSPLAAQRLPRTSREDMPDPTILFREINLKHAVVERLSREDLRTQVIAFDLQAAVQGHDPRHDLELRPGDVVTVYSAGDGRTARDHLTRLVSIEGEVAAPGVYQLLPGETLPQLLTRAGGLTPEAYPYGTDLRRREVQERQRANLALARERAEILAETQAARTSANQRDRASVDAIQASNQAVVELQRSQLRRVQPTGRLAVALDADRSGVGGLPDVVLEHADRIHVPARPNTVTVAGAVVNDNALLWKPGRTVAEYLSFAGTDESADVSNAFVVRADGIVVGRNRGAGLWRSGAIGGYVLSPGDAIIVPNIVDYEFVNRLAIRSLKQIGDVFQEFGFNVAAYVALRTP